MLIAELLRIFGKAGFMARTVIDTRLTKREHRRKLALRKEPYWALVGEGLHLGYAKGQRGGKWLVRWREAGSAGKSYVQGRLGEADDVMDATGDLILNFGQAQKAATAWLEKLQASDGRRHGPYSVNQALDDYLAQSTMRDKHNTELRLNAYVRPAIGKIDTAKLTATRLETLQRDIAAGPALLRTTSGKEQNIRAVDGDDADGVRKRKASANRIMSMLKAALNYGFQTGRIASDTAWRRVKPFKAVDAPRLRFLSQDEAQRLVRACEGDFRALVMAGLLTGARYQEIARLRTKDFDHASATLWIDRTKAGAGRPVYLDPEGVRLVEAQSIGKKSTDLLFLRNGREWRASEPTRPLRDAVEIAGIEACNFHDIRRSYGARLALQGVPMAVIAQALGHKSTRITERHYAHLQRGYVSDTIRAAVSGLGIVDEKPAGNVAAIGAGRR
jgi:integrase